MYFMRRTIDHRHRVGDEENLSPVGGSDYDPRMREFTVIGHRGACALEPENTLRSVRRAIADGADMVEIDVRLADNEIVVIHDDTVDRTTDGTGSVYQMSHPELRGLDAGKGEKIPTLAEVLELTLPSLPLNIELKDTAVTPAVCEWLRQVPDLDLGRIVISSFHAEATRQARDELPEIPIGILARKHPRAVGPMFELAHELDAVSVHPHVESLDAKMIDRAHDSSFRVLPYTTRTPDELQHVLDCGADGCFADDPKWAAEIAGYEK